MPRRKPRSLPLFRIHGTLVAALCAIAPAQQQPDPDGTPEPTLALRAGTVHPVSGPPITDGVVLIAGERILAVGPAGEVEVPEGVPELAYPDGHAYPGLVDALSTAYVPGDSLGDKSVDAGSQVADGLDPFQEEGRELVMGGVTTAYVANRSEATWRGQGTLVRPRPDGMGRLSEAPSAPVQLRMTSGTGKVHPLDRARALAGIGKAFEALEKYEKQHADHEQALEKYREAFEKWLDHHREKKGEKKDGGEPAKGGSGKKKGNGEEQQEPPAGGGKQDPSGDGKGGDEADKEEGDKKEEKKDEGPKRPKYPKPPAVDPAKEALIDVREGERPLRVEVHRVDEIEAALRLAEEHGIPELVLEHAETADRVTGAIARRGAAVVVTGLTPGAVPEAYAPVDGSSLAGAALPARLAEEGVAFAIASGSVDAGRQLALAAAWAAGHGLDPEEALRAVTATPARILGIADRVGSLEPDKLADVVVSSGPLFASSSRVLRVITAGTTVFEAAR